MTERLTQRRKDAKETVPLIIGHRGASRDAPENTLAAFELAFEQGADGLEFDVRLARDGVAVIIHDATLERTARRRGFVSSLTSKELSETDVGAWFDSRRGRASSFAGQHVPTLSQVFEIASKRARALYVEMKFETGESYAPLAARVAEEIRRHNMQDRAVVESFNLEAIKHFKRLAPDMRAAALFERSLARPLPNAQSIIERALDCGADEIALHYTLATRRIVSAAQVAGIAPVVWTVDRQSWVDRALLAGVRALITNRPAHMRTRLDALLARA